MYTCHQRCNACIQIHENDEALQTKQWHSEVVIPRKKTTNYNEERKQEEEAAKEVTEMNGTVSAADESTEDDGSNDDVRQCSILKQYHASLLDATCH